VGCSHRHATKAASFGAEREAIAFPLTGLFLEQQPVSQGAENFLGEP
jgi:hypothetical protein